MHIPTSPTTYIDVLPFDEALEEGLRPHADYDVDKWLYVPNRYDEYRYILGTRGKKPVICIGINPSTADPTRLDPTLQSVERIATGNGFDGFMMLNVYAQRATVPTDLDKACNPILHRENLEGCELVSYPLIVGQQIHMQN